MESRGKPPELTVEKVLEELNRLKKKHHADRLKWQEREKKLVDSERVMRRQMAEAEAKVDASKDRPPTEAELAAARDEGLSVARALLLQMKAKHDEKAAEWADLTGKERGDSSQEMRIWAHPFVGHILSEAVSTVQELKGELNGHGTEKESGAG